MTAAANTLRDNRFVALLSVGAGTLANDLRSQVGDDLLVIDINGPQLSRVNFDAVGLAVLELTPEQLLSSGGRRLVDVLGRLAEESLTLALVGPPVAAAGTFLEDGITAGLNLIPHSIVLANVAGVTDLPALLATASRQEVRLLVLDKPAGALYQHEDDSVTAQDEGNVLLVGFRPGEGGAPATARMQNLTRDMRRRWPA